jgi:hypothetical protein
MAVFAGGFISKKVVTKTMLLTSEKGVQAHGHEADPKVISENLMETMNTMLRSPEQEEIVMEECKQVFLKSVSGHHTGWDRLLGGRNERIYALRYRLPSLLP